MMKHTLLAALLAAGASTGAFAQLHESVSVDGTYVPDVIMLERLHTFPTRQQLSMAVTPMSYEMQSVAAAFDPAMLHMPATGWRDSRLLPTSRGYLELGAGSWLNSTLSAGYRFADTRDTRAGIRLQHNSTSLWRPRMSEITDDVKRFRYDENIGIYASHQFEGKGRLDASLDWHYGYFNYYGYDPAHLAFTPAESLSAPTQTLNDLALQLGWSSTPRNRGVNWHAGFDMRHFAYRALPMPSDMGYEEAKGDRETRLGFAGGFAMPWDGGSTAGIDARLDVVTYAKRDAVATRWLSLPEAPGSYAMLSLSPYYRFCRGHLNIKAGVDVDLTFNADGSEPDSHYSLLHLAPEVTLDWRRNATGLYLHLTGGTQLQTLAYGYELDYYQMPAIVSTQPVHTPLDARAGALFGPFGGFSAGAEVAYKIEQHRRDAGWYQILLNRGTGVLADVDSEGRVPIMGTTFSAMTVQGFSLGLNARYVAGNLLTAHGEVHYQPQKGTTGYFNGYDRPRVTARIEAEVNPWRTLKVGLQYDYRGVRNVYTLYPEKTISGDTGIVVDNIDNKTAPLRLPDITALNLKASYSFTPAIGVWLQADNLLNRRNLLLPGLPTEGIAVTGGVQWLF